MSPKEMASRSTGSGNDFEKVWGVGFEPLLGGDVTRFFFFSARARFARFQREYPTFHLTGNGWTM